MISTQTNDDYLGLPTAATSNNQKLCSAGEIDTRCRKINKTLTDLYYDIAPRAE